MQPSGARRKSEIRTALVVVVVVLAAIAVLGGSLVSFPRYVVSSTSMERTLLKGERVFVDRIGTAVGRPLQHGDVIAYRQPVLPWQRFVGRVVGVPGDRLHFRDRLMYRNGEEVREPYTQHTAEYIAAYRDNSPSSRDPRLHERVQEMLANHVVNGELVIPGGRYFVMGDNRDDALDSRYFGFIQRSDVTGRVVRIYASPDPSRVWKRVD